MRKTNKELCRSIRLCVDSCRHGELKGRYYHPALEGGGRRFESLTEFLIYAENLFDAIDFPQAFTTKRSFARSPGAKAGPGEQTGPESSTGACGTFLIYLSYRQHTSWQGRVTWLEGGAEQPFRSVLELIFLMDSALGACEEDSRKLPQAGRRASTA